jgi:hypothetical protein
VLRLCSPRARQGVDGQARRLRSRGQTGLTPDHPEPFDQDIGNEQIPNGLP